MNRLIKNVLEYKNGKDEELFEEIIKELNQTLNKHIFKIAKEYQEDLKQEYLFEIYKVLFRFKPEKELLSSEATLMEVKNKYCLVLKNKYYKLFAEKYNINIDKINKNKKMQMIDVINEFYLFCNENQFRKYINIVCKNKRIDFYRKHKISEEEKLIRLNQEYEEEELLYKLISEEKETSPKKDLWPLSKKDKEFLNLFIEGNKLLTEKEVAKKKGVSQQAISSMLKRIKERCKKETVD